MPRTEGTNREVSVGLNPQIRDSFIFKKGYFMSRMQQPKPNIWCPWQRGPRTGRKPPPNAFQFTPPFPWHRPELSRRVGALGRHRGARLGAETKPERCVSFAGAVDRGPRPFRGPLPSASERGVGEEGGSALPAPSPLPQSRLGERRWH